MQILFRIKFDTEHIRKLGKSPWGKHQTCSFCSDLRNITVNTQSSNKRWGEDVYLRALWKEGGVYKSFGFFNFTWVQNKHRKHLNIKVRVRNSNKKTQGIYNSLNKTFYSYIWILYKKQKILAKGIIKGPLHSIISKHFKMNLRWLEGQKLVYTQMSTLIKFFFIVKSFKTFYLIQYHKNAFHNELFPYIPYLSLLCYISLVW